MNPADPPIIPDWKWATAEGSRELDRLLDRRLSFREKLEWLESAETLSLRFAASRQDAAAGNERKPCR
jgi:hypothetical protein